MENTQGLRLRCKWTRLLASSFTVTNLLISNTWVTQIRQSTQCLGKMFLYMYQSNDQETEAAFLFLMSSHRAVRGTVSFMIDRGQGKEQVPNMRDV